MLLVSIVWFTVAPHAVLETSCPVAPGTPALLGLHLFIEEGGRAATRRHGDARGGAPCAGGDGGVFSLPGGRGQGVPSPGATCCKVGTWQVCVALQADTELTKPRPL